MRLGWIAVAGAVIVALLWAVCYPLVTTAVRYASPLHIGALRALIAGALLLALSLATGRPHPRGWAWLGVGAIGVTSTGLGLGGMFLAGGRISPGIATVIANGQPLLAAMIGRFALEEKLTGRQGAGMGTAFVGIALVAAPATPWFSDSGSGVTAGGVSAVLLGAIGVAVGNVVMKRFAARLDPVSATAWQLLVGSAGLFGAVLVVPGESTAVEWTLPFVLALGGLAIPGTAVAFVLWLALMQRAPLNVLNLFSFLTPLFALALGAAFYGERLAAPAAAGAFLVVAGAWIGTRAPAGHRTSAQRGGA